MPIMSQSNNARKKKFTGPAIAPYSDDVMTTLLYTGSGSTQNQLATSLTGFNLGGLFWSRYRSGAPENTNHHLFDTLRQAGGGSVGTNTASNNLNAQLASFNDNGVTLNNSSIGNNVNTGSIPYVGWFMKIAKSFFTMVQWVGNGTSTRSVPHDLQQQPGFILVKAINGGYPWLVWHRSATGDLDTTAGAQTASKSLITGADINNVILGNSVVVNGNGIQFEAFIWAHDVSPTGIVVSDTFTCDATGSAAVNCGWPVQWLIMRNLAGGNWFMLDSARGPGQLLYADNANAEIAFSSVSFTAQGFNVSGMGGSAKYVFTAVRTPNKPGNPNTLVLAGGNTIDLRAAAIANGWDQSSALTVNITADVGSTTTASPAILIAGLFPLGVTINVMPGVMVAGRGGLGGNHTTGNGGGAAFAVTTNNPVYINNQGTIAGGGGGGGGYWNGTNFGGNGAGLPILAPQGSSTTATRTNGGNGQTSVYGPGGVGGAAGSNGAAAPQDGGSGGGGGLGGNGGASSPRGAGTTYSDPGNQGQGGPGTSDSDATAWGYTTYQGGPSGAYVVGNSKVNWLATGTRYGPFVA